MLSDIGDMRTGARHPQVSIELDRKLDDFETSSTARIDRRNTVLAQIEAALLADKLALLELADERAFTGTDPYNLSKKSYDAWGSSRR
jgi:hypothetical protein